jgi:hypothetical protein
MSEELEQGTQEQEIEQTVEQESLPEQEESTEQPSLPELTNEQLSEMLLNRKDFKIPVKVDGREELMSVNDFRNRLSHQSAVSKRMNELVQREKEINAAREEFKYLLKNDPQKLGKILGVNPEALGIPSKESTSIPKKEPSEVDSLKEELRTLKEELSGLKGSFDGREQESIQRQIQAEFDTASQKYPVLQNKELQRYAAFLMYNNPDLATEDAFKQVSDIITSGAKNETQNIINSKKEAAKKSVITSNSVASVYKGKKIEDLQPEERLNAILEKAKLGGY